MAESIVAYYQELFNSANPTNLENTTQYINTIINEEMNAKLVANFEASEVHDAIKQMAPLKAPDSNGMPLIFYQSYWDLLGEDVTFSVFHFLNSTSLPANFNHTFITLIPKVKNLEFMSEFRPISLCNVLYKIFSNVLGNRLKKILPNIITENQSAFTKSRLISNNILMAFESLHSMQRHTGKYDYMAIKLDMSKAYNRVEWVYLEAVMRKMEFDKKWIRLMMTCITVVSYSILINGEPKGLITPTHGIKQGDLLSPFLFLLCTEGLNVLIVLAANRGDIKGFALCRSGPRLTHPLFADNSLLFCRATDQECSNILEILEVYKSYSGQQINRNKTTIFFSKLTSKEKREYIKQVLGVPEIKQYEKYLGLPSFVGEKKPALNSLRKRFGGSCKGGRKNYYPRLGERS